MSLTTIRRLCDSQQLALNAVGMLHFGTQELMDRSKSAKSEIMALMEVQILIARGSMASVRAVGRWLSTAVRLGFRALHGTAAAPLLFVATTRAV